MRRRASAILAVGLVVGCTALDIITLHDKTQVLTPDGAVDPAIWDALCQRHQEPAGCDLCDVLGWYGDAVCDTFCPHPDPDCGSPPPPGTSYDGTPYGGTPWPVPGTIEAEDYDLGGEGVAYHDIDATNTLAPENPSVDRGDGVDLKTCVDTAGCGAAVGTFDAGEWLSYTVDVARADTYTFAARVATIITVAFHVEVDGVAATGSIAVPANESYWNGGWETVTASAVILPAGVHVVRIVNDAGYFDLNDFTLSSASAVVPPAPAQTAGFTTLAVNYDFSAPTYASSSDWLGCYASASGYDETAKPWYQGLWWHESEPACDVSQVYDTAAAANVLDLRWLPAYAGQGTEDFITLSTISHDGTQVTDFPNAYFEMVARVSNRAVNPGGVAQSAFWTWGTDHVRGGGAPIEWDFWQLYGEQPAPNDTAAAEHNWGNGDEGSGYVWMGSGNLPVGWEPTQYHTYGFGITSDGTRMVGCSYVDGQLIACRDPGATAAEYTQRNFLIVWNGGSSEQIDMYVQSIRVWSCADWMSAMCNGPVIGGDAATTP